MCEKERKFLLSQSGALKGEFEVNRLVIGDACIAETRTYVYWTPTLDREKVIENAI